MERVKGERGRARARQRHARPATGLGGAVHDMIAETASATPREWCALLFVALTVVLGGLLEGSTWPM